MMKDKLFATGLTGTIVAIICCFTPLLVWLLTGVGLAGTVVYLDFALLPALGLFLAITGYAVWRRTQTQ